MKLHDINPDVLSRTFKCDKSVDLTSYKRIDTWGEGSCLYHAIAIATARKNRVLGNEVEFVLALGPRNKMKIRVPMIPNHPLRNSFYRVGVTIRRNLAMELKHNPGLWKQFLKENNINERRSDRRLDAMGAIQELLDIEEMVDIWTIRYSIWRLCINVLFVNPKSPVEPIYCGVENFHRGNNTMFIYWSNGMHFEPIVKIKGGHFSTLFGQDHAFVKCIKVQYNGGCPFDPIE